MHWKNAAAWYNSARPASRVLTLCNAAMDIGTLHRDNFSIHSQGDDHG